MGENLVRLLDHAGKREEADRTAAPVEPDEVEFEQSIDLAFVDADKPGYQAYLDLLLPLLSDRGVILVDNVLWSGAVVGDEAQDASTVALRAFNDGVAARDDVTAVMLPIGDGVTMIRHR